MTMPVVILAGGLGTRLMEKTEATPKPMVEVGGLPILWHIMKIYAAQSFKTFVVALGYKGEVIKDYFVNYRYRASNCVLCHLQTGVVTVEDTSGCEAWKVFLLNTGLRTQTGGRVKRAAEFLGAIPFMLTYGDGVADVDIKQLLDFHRSHGKLATVTAVRPPARFGGISFDGARVASFKEKSQIGEGWINGGFFVLEPGVADYIAGDATLFEREPLEQLAFDGQLMVYRHDGFWQCMDTLRDVQLLESLWRTGDAPWKVWDND